MARLPLLLSAHSSAWSADIGSGERKAGPSSGTCRFCGQETAEWQEAFHLNDDHTDDAATNVVVSCPLCHLAQHLGRPEIEREAVLIWLPEMAQSALNLLVREMHLRCLQVGVAPRAAMEATVSPGPAAARDAHAALGALRARAQAADTRLGTTSPRQLGLALLEMSPGDYARRGELLGGTRLLPLGQVFQDGRDVYPDMLQAWIRVTEPNRSTAA